MSRHFAPRLNRMSIKRSPLTSGGLRGGRAARQRVGLGHPQLDHIVTVTFLGCGAGGRKGCPGHETCRARASLDVGAASGLAECDHRVHAHPLGMLASRQVDKC